MEKSDKNRILNYLKKHKLMAIATYGDAPWTATVYYIVDDNLNFYFLSSSSSQHGQDIARNKRVAANVFDSHQRVTDKKAGVQLWGICTIVQSEEKIEWVLKRWHKTNPGSKYADLKKIKAGET